MGLGGGWLGRRMAGWVGEWNGWGLYGVVPCLSSGLGVAVGDMRHPPALPAAAGQPVRKSMKQRRGTVIDDELDVK